MPALPLHRRMVLARQHAQKSHPNYHNPIDVCLRVGEIAGAPFAVSALAALEAGSRPMHPHMVAIAQAYGVRPKWLIAGHGAMLEGGAESQMTASDLTTDERRLLRGYRAASPKMRKAFLRFADFVALAMDPAYDEFVAARRESNSRR